MATNSPLTRKQLAHAAGVGIESIRFYENRRLLDEPARSPSGYRIYDEAAVERLRFIRRAKELGFTLGEIEDLIGLVSRPRSRRSDLRRRASVKVQEIEGRVRDLQSIADALSALVRTCNGKGAIAGCPIFRFLNEKSLRGGKS